MAAESNTFPLFPLIGVWADVVAVRGEPGGAVFLLVEIVHRGVAEHRRVRWAPINTPDRGDHWTPKVGDVVACLFPGTPGRPEDPSEGDGLAWAVVYDEAAARGEHR